LELIPFQIECCNELDWFGGRALLASDMGTGKTVMALEYVRRHPKSFPCVIVCPASVKFVWQHEILRFLGKRASIADGQRPPKQFMRPPILIINYDILRHWLPWLRKMKPKLIVIDESQYLANNGSKRTKAARELCKGNRRVLALSGTPLLNRPIELFPVLHILRPDEFSSRWSFAQQFCAPKYTPWGWDYKGASNLDKLHELLTSTVMVRRRKVDVLHDLPEKVRSIIPIPLSNPSEYYGANEDFMAWLYRLDPTKALGAARAEAVVKVGYLLRLTAELKLPFVIEWVNNWLANTDEKLVLFAVHRKIVQALHEQCKTKSVVIDGSVTGRKRQETIKEFQHGSSRLLIGNIKAAGVGITLTASHTIAFTELGWTPGSMTQAEDRCHRIGTTETVWINYLVAHGTIEEKLCALLQQKQQVLSKTLDGGKMKGDLNILDELLRGLTLKRDN